MIFILSSIVSNSLTPATKSCSIALFIILSSFTPKNATGILLNKFSLYFKQNSKALSSAAIIASNPP